MWFVTTIFYTVDVNDNHSEQNQQKKWNGREILQYHNHNLSDVVMPVKADLLALMLQESNYDQQEIEFLHNGFMKGFDICYEGPQDRQSRSENIPFTVGDEVDLWKKLMKEVKLKQVAGPYLEIPFHNYIQSPIGLVPKSGEQQTRLIFHLSFTFKKEKQDSVNAERSRNTVLLTSTQASI